MERNSSGALRRGSSDPHWHVTLSSCSLHITHVCWLLGSGAAAFGRSTVGRSTADDAASGRIGASGAAQRGLRPHCGAAASGFTGMRRRLGRALNPPTEAST
jgi:hypothetical protein